MTKALSALLRHIKLSEAPKPDSNKLPLLTEPVESLLKQPIFFQLTTKHILTADSLPTLKPLAIPLPHSPFPSTATAIVITGDPHDKYVEKCRSNPRVQIVLGMGALRKTYNSYEQLRRLRDGDIIGEEPALVLADEKIVVSLPRILGKAFYRTPRATPIAVKLAPANIEKVIDDAFKKTYVRKNSGNCVAVRVGFAGMSVEELVENCVAVWNRCVSFKRLVRDGVDGVRAGYVKSGSSVALPVWYASELYANEDILENTVVKKVKSKVDRNLIKPAINKDVEEQRHIGVKRTREDEVEKSFEEKRARRLAKQNESAKN